MKKSIRITIIGGIVIFMFLLLLGIDFLKLSLSDQILILLISFAIGAVTSFFLYDK